jgi:hypothetical protein
MHSHSSRTEFLRLRVQGLSLAAIGRRLGISKPTLIKWNREAQSQINAAIVADQQLINQEIATTASEQLADLNKKLHAIKQELLSRSLRDISTPVLETLAGDLRQKIESIKSGTNYTCLP